MLNAITSDKCCSRYLITMALSALVGSVSGYLWYWDVTNRKTCEYSNLLFANITAGPCLNLSYEGKVSYCAEEKPSLTILVCIIAGATAITGLALFILSGCYRACTNPYHPLHNEAPLRNPRG